MISGRRTTKTTLYPSIMPHFFRPEINQLLSVTAICKNKISHIPKFFEVKNKNYDNIKNKNRKILCFAVVWFFKMSVAGILFENKNVKVYIF